MGEIDGIARCAEQNQKNAERPQMDTVASIWGFLSTGTFRRLPNIACWPAGRLFVEGS